MFWFLLLPLFYVERRCFLLLLPRCSGGSVESSSFLGLSDLWAKLLSDSLLLLLLLLLLLPSFPCLLLCLLPFPPHFFSLSSSDIFCCCCCRLDDVVLKYDCRTTPIPCVRVWGRGDNYIQAQHDPTAPNFCR